MKKYFEVGQRLRKLRGDTPQKKYAKRMGISYRAYQNYESGERIPQPKTLNKIATKESVTVDWILMGKLRSLEEVVLAKKIEVSFLQERVDQLEKELIDELHKKGIPIPPDFGNFIDIAADLKRKGIIQEIFDLLLLDRTSPLFIMIKQIERIFWEGDKTKLKAVRGFLKALDPGKKKQDSDTQPGVVTEGNSPQNKNE